MTTGLPLHGLQTVQDLGLGLLVTCHIPAVQEDWVLPKEPCAAGKRDFVKNESGHPTLLWLGHGTDIHAVVLQYPGKQMVALVGTDKITRPA